MNLSRKKINVGNEDTHRNIISISTYNILADCHVLTTRYEDYHYVKDEELLKNEELNSKRHLLMMKELEHFNTDILLLQEVEDWYSSLLEKELKKIGYEYTYFQKVGVPEGSALCYKKEKFECIDTVKILLHDEVTKFCADENVPEVAMNQMAEPNVCIISTLKDMATGKVIIFATTHVIYDEFAEPAIQCLQVCLACKKIDQVRTRISAKLDIDEKYISVVFGGDFNGEPDHMSIQALKNGKLTESQMKKLETLTYNVVERKPVPMEFYEICHVSKYLPKYLEHPLKLSSAYSDAKGCEPVLTSSNGTSVGCLDYIFYTKDLKLVSVVDIDPSIKDEAFSIDGGPSEEYASDHLPLIAEFTY